MDSGHYQLIQAIHQSEARAVLVLAGGGSGAAASLLHVPGASRTILEVLVPYHQQALSQLLGYQPESFCSKETGQALARRAFERAASLCPYEQGLIGVGCTASLATDRPKRGEHRVFLSLHRAARRVDCSLTFEKGARSREEEERVVDHMILNALAGILGIRDALPLDLLPGEQLIVQERSSEESLEQFIEGQLPVLCIEPDGRCHVPSDSPALLLAGSFNPIHAGHWKLAEVAAELTGLPVGFELSVTNADKGTLSRGEVQRRLEQFAWRARVWLTRAPTFVEKARLLPGATFVVGVDTALRILSPVYYENDSAKMYAALQEIQARRGRFLVACRVDAEQQCMGLAHVQVPAGFEHLFVEIPESRFRHDISSSQLRSNHSAAGAAPDTGS